MGNPGGVRRDSEALEKRRRAVGQAEEIDFLKALRRHIDKPLMVVRQRLPTHRNRLVRQFVKRRMWRLEELAAVAGPVLGRNGPAMPASFLRKAHSERTISRKLSQTRQKHRTIRADSPWNSGASYPDRQMDGMQKLLGGFSVLTGFLVVAGLASAQSATAPDERESLAVTVPERTEGKVRLEGTERLPLAKGEATVRRRRGTTEIEVKLEQLKPAILFGGDFNTYVLWTVSPEGVAVNAGEFLQRGHRSRVDATTPLSTFGMFVTAEPHFLVDEPSSYVVLQNAASSLTRGSLMQSSVVKYRGFEGRYHADRDTLADEEVLEGDFRSERQQATTALNLAEREGAGRWAPEELARAREAVIKALEAYGPDMDEKLFAIGARKAVRLSFEAYQAAVRNRELAEEQAQREELAGLRVAKAEAEAAEAAAREEAEKARRERREALEAKSQAEEAARQAQVQQRLAREMMETAQAETRRLAALKAQSDRYANEARQRLEGALSKVVETRESARGVIVNLPDILFASGRSTLRPRAREVLSRVAGILLVTPEIGLSIEGHTDSTGGEDLNLRLSERRALAVADYLAESGVPSEIMATVGLGETQPIANNNSPAGRQRNRRVEIVIESTGDQAPFAQ